MEQTRQRTTAKVLLAAILTVFVTLAAIFAILPKSTLSAHAEGTTVDLSALTANYEAKDGETLTGTLGGNYKISIADGATVTLKDVTINGTNSPKCKWAGITCNGNATIILSGENTVTGFYEDYPGILVLTNKTLTIQGDGALTASAGQNGFGAGIGGVGNSDCGSIVIKGGTITANGGIMGAGIGNAGGKCGDITITGGTVIATGGSDGAGIGGGSTGTCGNITIANTVTKVTATKGESAANSIGIGSGGSCGTVTIGGVEGAITESPYTYEGTAQADGEYTITVEQPEGGTIGADVAKADAGATVTLTASPNGGMMLYEWTVTDAGNNPVTVADDGTFTMPQSNVKVTATFMETDHIVESLAGVAINGTAIGDDDLGELLGVGSVSISDVYATAPTVTFVKETSVYFVGESEPKVTTTKINVVAEGEDSWSAQATIGDFTYTISVAKAKTTDLSTVTADYVAQDGEILTGTLSRNYKISIAPDATVTLKDVNTQGKSNISCTGNATIILEGNNTIVGNFGDWPALYIPAGSTLTIEGKGSLVAKNTRDFNAGAGIGGGYNIGYGDIVINGGTITATGGGEAAGIGGGDGGVDRSDGNITINGGVVTATGGEGAPGIGSTGMGHCKYIAINGGVVTAYGGTNCPSIGHAENYWSGCDNVYVKDTIGILTAYKGFAETFYDEDDVPYTMEYDNLCAGRVYIGSRETWGVSETPFVYIPTSPSGVMYLISVIPDPVVYTSDCESAIKAAEELYAKLTDEQKQEVTTYEVLTNARTAYDALKAYYAASEIVSGKIDEIGTVEYTDDSKAKIDAAREAYDALESDQQAQVSNYADLTAAENAYAALKADHEAAEAVDAVIDEIGTVEYTDDSKAKIDAATEAYGKLTDAQKQLVKKSAVLDAASETYNAMDGAYKAIAGIGDVEYTDDSKAKIDAAKTAYEALDETHKAMIRNADVLMAAEAAYKTLDDTAKAQAVADQIDAIGEVAYTDESKAKIDAVRSAYDALDENDQKPLVTNLEVLEAAEAAYKTLDDADKANAVKALIENIGTVAYNADSKSKIDEAKEAYEALTEDQKALVDNYATLTAANDTYDSLKADHDAADAVKALIESLGTIEYNEDSKSKIDAAKAAYEALTAEQKALVDNYGALTTAETTYTEKEAEANASKGLPAGVVVLIVILGVLVLGCGGFAIFWFVIKKKTWAEFVSLVKGIFKKN